MFVLRRFNEKKEKQESLEGFVRHPRLKKLNLLGGVGGETRAAAAAGLGWGKRAPSSERAGERERARERECGCVSKREIKSNAK